MTVFTSFSAISGRPYFMASRSALKRMGEELLLPDIAASLSLGQFFLVQIRLCYRVKGLNKKFTEDSAPLATATRCSV
jgi:hypothetical protein